MECKECKCWVPHHLYPNMGYCMIKIDQLVFGNTTACEKYSTEKEGNLLWCRSCNLWVAKEEIQFHERHEIYLDVYEDPEAYIETYAGD